ncbi:MAG TPA: cation diffusion facilitator family transporter [Actinomycetota bacterium]|nr:cation diffusion facilitator family transporter [Actinomycetota bacterium]
MHPGHQHEPTRAHQRRALVWVLVVNALYTAIEIVAGLAFDSLALLADAAHMATDVAALGVALFAHRLVERPVSERHSYGLVRAEVLGASINALLLMAASVWIVVEAAGRIGSPADVDGAGAVVVATIGLAVNLVSALVLSRSAGQSLNMRGALLHMVADAVGSVGAIAAGVIVVVWSADRADPIVSVGIAALVAWSAWRLLKEATHVLLEGTPAGVDPGAVVGALRDDVDVEEVHHVHLWSLASDVPALSAHVVLKGEMTLHEAQLHGERLKRLLRERFRIDHSTLELECHACDPPVDVVVTAETEGSS